MIGIIALAAAAAKGTPAATTPPAKVVALSKVVLDSETAAVKGRLREGTLCVPQGSVDRRFKKERKTEDHDRYDALFAARLTRLGFHPYASSGELFAAEGGKERADVLVGATIRPDTIDACSSVKGEKGSVTLAVEWQVFDRAAHAVVATATTSGSAEQPQFARRGYVTMWNNAFTASLDAFVALGVLQRYVGPPTPVPADPPPPAR